jgi:homogentisate 1,2-dioxygenase
MLSGFGNHHQSEAIPNALPTDQNSPQICPFGLYAEQLSGSGFTRARHLNLHSWLYRTHPSVMQGDYTPYTHAITHPFSPRPSPNAMRWSPMPAIDKKQDFIDGLFHMAGNQSAHAYLYQCNESMNKRYFSTRDGELLFVPYAGTLSLHTEFGILTVSPGMIAVIPRGVYFRVELLDAHAAGYLCENSGEPFRLPELGLLGANALANPRHFLYPNAAFEVMDEPLHLICKYQQHTWISTTHHSPLNVVAWHGNYAPYCYDLSLFNALNTVSFDHPDPSIFTVLTSPGQTHDTSSLDFVIFPARWMVAEHTFRPPYFHRNIMSEFMGLIQGEYDAKAEGFHIGGVSIHNSMTPHGPDAATVLNAQQQPLKPTYYHNTLAFMFESVHPWLITQNADRYHEKQPDYSACWQSLPKASIPLK